MVAATQLVNIIHPLSCEMVEQRQLVYKSQRLNLEPRSLRLDPRAHLPCPISREPVHVPNALDGFRSLHVIVVAAVNAHGIALDRTSFRSVCRRRGSARLGFDDVDRAEKSPAICTVSHRRESASTQNCMISGAKPERVAS
jgi:hypothetical protein